MKTILSFVCSFLLLCSASLALANDTSININTADVETLSQLNGIGAKKAEAIIAWRDENGEFVSVDQLAEVQGIGEATVEANRELMTLN